MSLMLLAIAVLPLLTTTTQLMLDRDTIILIMETGYQGRIVMMK